MTASEATTIEIDVSRITAIATAVIPDGPDRVFRAVLEVTWDVVEGETERYSTGVSGYQFRQLDGTGIPDRFAREAESALVPAALEQGRKLLVALGCPAGDAHLGARSITC